MSNNENASIEQFDINNMVKNPSIIIIGPRCSGKSNICKYIINHLNVHTTILSPQYYFYKSCIPQMRIFNHYSDDLLKTILTNQIEMKTEEDICIVVDDCLNENNSWKKDKSILDLFYTNKHYHTTYILTMQNSLNIKPEIRYNFDYIFMLKDTIVYNQKLLYYHYANQYMSYETFEHLFSQYTQDFTAIVIVNTTGHIKNCHEKPLLDNIFWFKYN